MKLVTDSQWKAHQGLIADLKRQLAERDDEVKSLTCQLSSAEQKADDLNEKLIDVEHKHEVQAHRQAQEGEPEGAQKHVHECHVPPEEAREAKDRCIRELGNHYEQLAEQREIMGIDDASGDGRNYRRLAEGYFDMDLQRQLEAKQLEQRIKSMQYEP
jgi:chromosome segregation ATPase